MVLKVNANGAAGTSALNLLSHAAIIKLLKLKHDAVVAQFPLTLSCH